MTDFSLAMLRHALTTAGAVLVTKGIADEGTIEALAGGLIAFLSVGWAIWTKRAAFAKAPAA